jgi:hypothetical protein
MASIFTALVGNTRFSDAGLASKTDLKTSGNTDAQLLEALRLSNETIAPPDIDSMVGPLVEQFRSSTSTSDRLRLPRPGRFDGPALRGAVQRMLALDTGGEFGDVQAVAKEREMRRILLGLQGATMHIQANTPWRV